MPTILYIRNERNINEHRTPLIPLHIKELINIGFIIYIQSSVHRIYTDLEYKHVGAIITDKCWHDDLFNSALIIGIKDFINLHKLSNHIHIYFSHSYKNQLNSEKILQSFAKSDSYIYDFEYFLNKDNKRIIAFGYYAGLVGAVLGLNQYYNKLNKKSNINNLIPWNSYNDMISTVQKREMELNLGNKLNICIIGSNGRCGLGVQNILKELNLLYDVISKDDLINENLLKKYDIIYNCILLDEKYNRIWFDKYTNFNKSIIIVDISCDYSKVNNPILLYDNATSWMEPVYNYNEFVDIIAVDNLPSLLPKESSDAFSVIFFNLLLEYAADPNNYWMNNRNVFLEKINKY
jgi:saccharopine dehydrogenase (NAD+, L-lysine-forming)